MSILKMGTLVSGVQNGLIADLTTLLSNGSFRSRTLGRAKDIVVANEFPILCIY